MSLKAWLCKILRGSGIKKRQACTQPRVRAEVSEARDSERRASARSFACPLSSIYLYLSLPETIG